MPIRPEQRWFYPIDWAELSRSVRFRRARGTCEACGRPHGREVWHLGSLEVAGRRGLWWDEAATRPAQPGEGEGTLPDLFSPRGVWRCERGRALDPRILSAPEALLANPAQLAFWAGLELCAMPLKRSTVALACCHLDHDPTNNDPRNLRALCQRCHLAHDFEDNLARRREHRRVARARGLTLLPL